MTHLEPNSIAVLINNDIYPIGADSTMLAPRNYRKKHLIEVRYIRYR